MNDPFVSLSEIKKDMREFRDLSRELGRRLGLIREILNHIFSQVRKYENFEDVREYLECVDEIQQSLFLLNTITSLDDRSLDFIYDFERWGYSLKDYFEVIKEGRHKF